MRKQERETRTSFAALSSDNNMVSKNTAIDLRDKRKGFQSIQKRIGDALSNHPFVGACRSMGAQHSAPDQGMDAIFHVRCFVIYHVSLVCMIRNMLCYNSRLNGP